MSDETGKEVVLALEFIALIMQNSQNMEALGINLDEGEKVREKNRSIFLDYLEQKKEIRSKA